jgi:hypothetical protein
MTILLTFLGLRRERPVADDLDTALAGAQIGLERRRKQWLLWLVEERRAPLVARLAARPAASPPAPSAAPPEEPGDGA